MLQWSTSKNNPKNYLYFVVPPLCMCLQYVRVRSHKKREMCDIVYFHCSSALHMKLSHHRTKQQGGSLYTRRIYQDGARRAMKSIII